MIKRRLSFRELILSVLAFAFVLVFGYYHLIIAPLNHDIADIKSDIEQSALVMNKYRNLLAQKDSLLTAYKMISEKQREKVQYVSIVDMTADIQEIATGILQINSIRPIAQSPAAGELQKFSVELDLRADFESIIKFMYKLEKENTRLLISKTNINLLSGKDDQIHAKLFIQSIK